MIKLSLKGFAKYLAADSSKQRGILRDYKYPNPEGKAQRDYYRDARDAIRAYHKNTREVQWLRDKAIHLASMAEAVAADDPTKNWLKTKYNYNSRALKQYARHFSQKKYEIRESVSLELYFSGVRISVFPDLHVIEKKREKIIKLEFAVKEPDPKTIKVMSQALFNAQDHAGMGLTSASVLYLDVLRGNEYRGARVGARLTREMEDACKNIVSIWKDI